MRILYLAGGLDAPNMTRVKVTGSHLAATLEQRGHQVHYRYRVGSDSKPVIDGTDRGYLVGEGDAVISTDDFWSLSPDAVVLERGWTTLAFETRQKYFWRCEESRLPWKLAYQYLSGGGVVVALDGSLAAAGDTSSYRRVFTDPAIARLFGAYFALAIQPSADSASPKMQSLIDWNGRGRYVIRMGRDDITVARGLEDIFEGVAALGVGRPDRLFPSGEALLRAPGTVGLLRDDRASFTRPDAWTRFCFASYHGVGNGWAALIAGDTTSEDERFDAALVDGNACMAANLVEHLVRDVSGSTLHTHERASRYTDGSPLVGSRVLLLTVTESERGAVDKLIPNRVSDWDGHEAIPWWPISHREVEGVDFFHAPVAKGVQSALFMRLAVAAVQPRFVVMVGICAGLPPLTGSTVADQELGDVIICSQVRDLGQGRIVETDPAGTFAYEEEGSGGVVYHPDPYLLALAKASALTLSDCERCSQDLRTSHIFTGEIVAVPYVLKSARVRQWIQAQYQDAVALEMEGAPLALTASTEFATWILVKGIADWADRHKSGEYQATAAEHALGFVLHTLCHGADLGGGWEDW